MKRELSTNIYILAAVITAGIFLLGTLFGLLMEGKRVGYIDTQAKTQKLDFASIQLQFEYITQLNKEKNCPAMLKAMGEYFSKLADTEARLTNYQREAKLNLDDFNLLKKEYIQAEINYWLLVKKMKETCAGNVVTALYFYSDDKECPDCQDQAYVLSYLKDLLKDKFLVFSLDSQFNDEVMIGILKTAYNVTKYPTVVVGENVLNGYVNKEKMLRAVCKGLNSSVEECKP